MERQEGGATDFAFTTENGVLRLKGAQPRIKQTTYRDKEVLKVEYVAPDTSPGSYTCSVRKLTRDTAFGLLEWDREG
ncbi:hypothetical protein [Streptomyces sp. NPDC047014]|uniref:hypothetical protein n=1 Tax=Streptomyces sp. NPDC047014 TaxID=3155736 RepID=UPI0033C291DF